MKRLVTVCDGCATEKKEANHWFYGLFGTSSVRWFKKEEAARAEAERYPDYSLLELCGQGCATKEFEKWMAGGANVQQLPR